MLRKADTRSIPLTKGWPRSVTPSFEAGQVW